MIHICVPWYSRSSSAPIVSEAYRKVRRVRKGGFDRFFMARVYFLFFICPERCVLADRYVLIEETPPENNRVFGFWLVYVAPLFTVVAGESESIRNDRILRCSL